MSWAWFIDIIHRPPRPTKPPKPPPPAPTGLGASLLEASNAARAKAGLAPLRADARLEEAAAGHCDHMAATGVMSHAGFPARLNAAGYTYSSAAENVAAGQDSAQAVIESWLSSPGHRANLLGPYQDMGGSGAQASSGMWFWTACYANPA